MTIEVLFPETCCLYGDLQNVSYLASACGAEVRRTAFSDEPLFLRETPDLLYLGSAPESAQERAAATLLPYKERLRELIDGGANILATGNASELFGRRITGDDGADFAGLGLFDFEARREMMNRYNGLYLGKFGDMDIVGFKSQFAHTYGADDLPPLFETVRGDGRNRGDKREGLHVNNFMATYLLGPMLILNPDFAKYVLTLMGAENPSLPFEQAAYDAFHRRLEEFSDPARHFVY